jgi:hypothetical protein
MLPNPPIDIGIIIKDIINNPWNVIILVYCDVDMIIKPHNPNSIRIINDNE